METLNKKIIGRLESIDLLELAIINLQVRVDTGAKTSSLHVDNIVKFSQSGKPYVSFDIHPDVHDVNRIVNCTSPIADIRTIKSSNGSSEQRYVIKTPIKLGDDTWPIEITLTNRSDMNYLMLLGREAMGDHCLVDPSQTFIASEVTHLPPFCSITE
ncbi:ATP-dependent zinc protease family protein [Psychromonas sp. Urea-02u-13]|uniref:ATP-dependent zinc protease family protein n=1 Tax=Psychromonas sp. Urea-02u-13 TaxID=2058326 RepID=UPI000C340040|nr:RimK/LysX family protein [Psychromonas sp. Urea-02u-13]PKG39811.1 ATP-dependent zinc protease [Psychromonas sp. Urea-02u-13]